MRGRPPQTHSDLSLRSSAQVEEQEVLAITFHPDKAVACFLPPEEPVVLSKGLTPKPIRRGGMCRRAARDEVCSVVTMGEYEE